METIDELEFVCDISATHDAHGPREVSEVNHVLMPCSIQ